jgi:hypothetical protein
MAGFWKRRFEPPATVSQRWFDFIFGIVAPILCLVFDPAIFRNGFPAGMGFLVSIAHLHTLQSRSVLPPSRTTYYSNTGHCSLQEFC